MTNPFTVQPGTSPTAQSGWSDDGSTLHLPNLVLSKPTATPGPSPYGPSLYQDPTTGQPYWLDPLGGGHSLIDNEPDASWNGLTAWNMDPASANNTTILGTSGTVYLMRVQLQMPATISTVAFIITTAGATLTAGANWAGLYNNLGQLLATSADQTTAFASAGYEPVAMTAPVRCLPGFYYAAILATGTTLPTLLAGSGQHPANLSVGNIGLTAATARWLVGPAAQTTLPATIALGSQSMNVAATWWAAIN